LSCTRPDSTRADRCDAMRRNSLIARRTISGKF
jgi:hypothetical protein